MYKFILTIRTVYHKFLHLLDEGNPLPFKLILEHSNHYSIEKSQVFAPYNSTADNKQQLLFFRFFATDIHEDKL